MPPHLRAATVTRVHTNTAMRRTSTTSTHVTLHLRLSLAIPTILTLHPTTISFDLPSEAYWRSAVEEPSFCSPAICFLLWTLSGALFLLHTFVAHTLDACACLGVHTILTWDNSCD